MTTLYVCDGCGAGVEKPLKLGHVLKREYCEACGPRARLFVEAEEELRKRLHEQFHADRDLLIAKASEGGFKLPDIPCSQ